MFTSLTAFPRLPRLPSHPRLLRLPWTNAIQSNNHDADALAGPCWEAENQGRVDVTGLVTPFKRRPSVGNILGPATNGMYVVDSCPANSDFSITNGVLAQSGGAAYKNGICKASQNTRPDHCTGQKSHWYRYGPILFSAAEKLTPKTFQAKYYGGKCKFDSFFSFSFSFLSAAMSFLFSPKIIGN